MKSTRDILKLILLFSVSAFFSCGRKNYEQPLTAQVRVLEEEPYRTLVARSVGYGKSPEEAIADAEIKVFKILFFRGLPHTETEKPLIGPDEKKILEQHKHYFEEFFNHKYQSFIISSHVVSPPVKISKGEYEAIVDVEINLGALQRELESHGIIRRFGF